ncbi:MAG: magnesium transporter [Prolixibacteraceae bacterium]
MQFELTKDYIEQLEEWIDKGTVDQIKESILDLHPADIAEILEMLSMDDAMSVYLLLEGDLASDVLLEIPEDDRRRFLAKMPSDVIARQYIEFMDTDDAADVIGELPDSKREEVMNYIDDAEHFDDIQSLLSYDEDTAGGIMAAELVAVKDNWSVQTCLKEIGRQAEDIDEIYYVYVISDKEELRGVLSLKKLIQYPTQTLISNIYNKEVISINTSGTREEVAQKMSKYDLVALPVVDDFGRLKGRITIDDVVDIIREEAEKDYQMASGLTGDVSSGQRIWNLTKARLPWLSIGFIGEIVASRVLGSHQDQFIFIPGIAFFMPLIVAMGGNVGVQSTSIVLQKLAGRSKDMDSILLKLLKEISVALIMAVFFAILLFVYFYFTGSNKVLTYTVSSALFIVIIFAALFGTLFPLMLNKMKIDPAMATGPFITTTNDILGLLIYMSMGQYFNSIL